MKRANSDSLKLLRNQITDQSYDLLRVVRFRLQAAEKIATQAASSITGGSGQRSVDAHLSLHREIEEEITALHAVIEDYRRLKRQVMLRKFQLEHTKLEREAGK